jgi:hypothetical protein
VQWKKEVAWTCGRRGGGGTVEGKPKSPKMLIHSSSLHSASIMTQVVTKPHVTTTLLIRPKYNR